MSIIEAVLLGIIEGVTEFLPVSSTAHLTIAEKLLGHSIDSPDIVAFTAIIQVGAILATLVYFRQDIARLLTGWTRGLISSKQRGSDYHFAWAVFIGSLPIGVVGLAFKDQIETGLRSLWLVATALILWSGVMWYADRHDKGQKHEKDITWKDTLVIGLAQCIALVPGVSRSGATISAGLLKGFDRVAVTRLSFFLAIPALTAAGVQQAISHSGAISEGVGWGSTLAATVVSFVVAYASIAWLLKYVARHNFTAFITYRVALGAGLMILLAAGAISAT